MNKNLFNSMRELKAKSEKYIPTMSGILGLPIDGNLAVEVPNRQGYVYVRLRDTQNEVIQAYNDRVSPVYNLPVLVQRNGNRWRVIDRDVERYENWGTWMPFLPKHGDQHSFNRAGGGGDVVWVFADQFMPLLTYPSGTKGAVNALIGGYMLQRDADFVYVGNTGTIDLVQYKPTDNTARMGLVYLNKQTGNFGVLVNSGTSFSAGITGSAQVAPFIPYPPSPSYEPMYAFRLVSGTQTIQWGNLYNARQFYPGKSTGTPGGGGAPSGPAGGDLTGTYPNPIVKQASQAFALTNIVTSYQSGTSQIDNLYTAGLETATEVIIDADGPHDVTLTGLSGGASGRLLIIRCGPLSSTVTITSDDSASLAQNRFQMGVTTSLIITSPQAVVFKYSDSRWRLLPDVVIPHPHDAASGGKLTDTAKRVLVTNYLGEYSTDPHFYYDPGANVLIIGGVDTDVPAVGTNALHIVGSGTGPTNTGYSYNSGTSATASIPFFAGFRARGDGTIGSVGSLLKNMGLVRLAGRGHDGSTWSNTQGQVLLVADEDWDASHHGLGIGMYATPTGTTSQREVMHIYGDGNVNLTQSGTYNVNGTPHSHDRYYIPFNGWTPIQETWTRTGNYTFTISGADATNTYRVGTKVRYKDGGSFEYGVVKSSSFAGSTTTITLITNDDYAMAAATITDRYISYIENPEGWPDWFNWTPTYTGFSSDPPTTFARFKVLGNTIFLVVDTGQGTSNTTAFTITNAPVNPSVTSGFPMGLVRDNSVILTTGCRLAVNSGSATLTLRSDMANGTWTAANNKSANFSIFYQF